MSEREEVARKAYAEGRWCGECKYGVVEDPPCCTAVSPDLDALLSEAEAWIGHTTIPSEAGNSDLIRRLVAALRSVQVPVTEEADWTYFVTLDGDYAGEYATRAKAEAAFWNERGHVAPERRRIWRERTVTEFLPNPLPSPGTTTEEE